MSKPCTSHPGAFSRRSVLVALASAGAVQATGFLPAWAQNAPAWRRYDRSIVIDGLGGPGGGDQQPNAPLTTANIAHTRSSGLACTHVTLTPVGTTAPDTAFRLAISDMATWQREIDAHADVLTHVRSVDDILAAKKAGKTGILFGFQDGVAFETDLANLDVYYRGGLRVVQPTYNRRNLLGDGCLEPANAGLSRAGVEAIERLNELGILIDLSHCGRQTAADAIRLSKRPVAFTHTGCAGLIDHPRNRTDEELRAAANKGGVAGIYIMPFLSNGRQPTGDDVLRHIEHAIRVAGEDHVAIGTDGSISPTDITPEFQAQFARFVNERRAAGIGAPGETEQGYLFAADLNTPRRFETLAGMLSARGHSDARIEKVLGQNLLRVFKEAWKTSG
jgi:membrane dipeptidase